MLSQFVGFLFTTYNIQLTVIFQAKKKKKKKNHLSDSTKNNNRLYKLLVNVSEMNPRVGFFLTCVCTWPSPSECELLEIQCQV